MRRITSALLCVCLIGFSAACAQLGLTTPQSFGQSLMYGYSTNESVREATAGAVERKSISKEDAQRVLQTTNVSRAALDEAMKAGCPKAWEAYQQKKQVPKEPACLGELPKEATARLDFALGLANQALSLLQAYGVKAAAK